MDYIELFMINYRRILLLRPDFKIPDDMLAYLMLSQLPNECFTVKSQFLDVEIKPSLNKVREILTSWWQSRKGINNVNEAPSNDNQPIDEPAVEEAEANPASINNNEQYNRQREGRADIICFRCGAPGHIARDCRSKEGSGFSSNNLIKDL